MSIGSAKGLRVVSPGILTLPQDLGRFGYQHLGISTGGAADEHAFLWANRLLGNPSRCAALEICIGGLQLEAEVATRIAITGADLQAKLNGMAIPPWRTFNVSPGDHLQFAYAKNGVRAYLAVQGGLEIKPTFGSVATVMREQVGGLDGRGSALQEGDRLPCSATATSDITRVPPWFIPDYRQPLTLRVIEGHQHHLFDTHNVETFYSATYELTSQSDRMGVRLSGEPLESKVEGIISEGISFGAVQIPPDGQPIILLKDRQTIGGYPKIGTLLALDAFALSQRPAGTLVRFESIKLRDAQRILTRFYMFFNV